MTETGISRQRIVFQLLRYLKQLFTFGYGTFPFRPFCLYRVDQLSDMFIVFFQIQRSYASIPILHFSPYTNIFSIA